MKDQYRKVKKYLNLLESKRWRNIKRAENITICPCDYKTGNTPPSLSDFSPFENGGTWGSGKDSHAWFHLTAETTGPRRYVFIEAPAIVRSWVPQNPQLLAYVNGKMRQGVDRNHCEVYLGDEETADIYIYANTSMFVDKATLTADFRDMDDDVDGLYYDVRFPFEMLDYLDTESAEYGQILYFLYRAVSMLELYDMDSEDFRESVRRAREYLEKEFYTDYCRPQTAKIACIGHTHIDCAWLWTFRQSREKVQRSFATVLELMKRYPEYKFMSSQPLLYKYLKQEAPELYREVGERIREGRWECEGAMWVEADCNLTSGESLVRQVLYGKNFFRDEFGADNRVLWLPDVFGYSAALPQILRKSGVDWFVTSKIGWNDTNRMPYDTFRWRGIDGTEIHAQFLTDQGASRNATKTMSTYNGKTDAPMLAGAYKRYSQKHITDETLITFGYGDGGGGPNREHLELARRGKRGVPGCPEAKIEFAGDFLRRLEEAMKNNPDVPTWQGELYLEFHRGTYTTMARNKRNNRKSEFLYQDAELLATAAKTLFDDAFPKERLHEGWENILSNQFHDVIPGSSIKDVYEQCDIDYAAIRKIGEDIVDGVRQKIAASVDKRHGVVVFNPHSFSGDGLVKVNGKSVLVRGVAPKGYTVTKDFVSTNSVRIEGHTVETDALCVRFDDAWQMVSIYDKGNEREVLKAGAVGNELRVYADYPDNYDAWEWQSYSRDSYRTLTEVSVAEIVEDGARRGIRIVRPHMKSTVTQTVWFCDGTTQMDFETVVDWHEHHQMLKAVFPVDINADKATYEIQFGTVERPTHSNTSWDRARFEVCAHKYADLSEGGYGVSLMNDCKYGHDIHDGVMQLSLLRSPTYPNSEADQGEIVFTYSLYPHAGRLSDTDTVKRTYALNYPMTAVSATGEGDRVPLSFSAVSVDSDHVICETVKEEERGTATVVRMYECKNMRQKVTVTPGIPATRVFLCDMMENELCELPLTDGKFDYTFSGFEIVTFKVV